MAAQGTFGREVSVCLFLLALTSGCTQQRTKLAPAAGTLEVGLYRLEAGKYTDLTTGEVTFGADLLGAQLADANAADDTFLRMVRGVGGFEKYNYLLDTSAHEELRALHKRYGVGYPDNPPRPSNSGRAR